ncbi:LuxR C-terminal-related transcriptional regulator [Arthrobacter halodurans]|uniref:LuxR C-terminal-related transcriptional regulator n=1 Tax=Arthrobacter halodurans TaxID=516699 RepID=A0ABV4UQY5_9MICC
MDVEAMMDEFEVLRSTARAAYARGDWHAANEQLERARELADLPTEDLDLLGSASWWVGRVRDSLAISEEVYHRFEDGGDRPRAAMKAVNLGLLWFIRGDLVIASGWAHRARRILADLPEGPERGYLLYLDASIDMDFHDLGPTRAAAAELRELGRRLRAPQLTSLGLVLSGLCDVRDGDAASGFAQLDEAMLPVLAGRMPPEWAGDIYCTVIHACHDVADLARMRAWTRATEQWCEQFHGEVVYSGICRIHRLQLLCVEGSWDRAEPAIERSGTELIGRNNWVAGEAFYQLGEIRRLRGDAGGARAAYAQATELGTEPQPGESLLQRAEGRKDDAWAGLCAALAGRDRLASARLLGSAVDVALELGLADEAEQLCRDLEDTAAAFGTAGFRAWAAQARASVLVSGARYSEALPVLRAAAAEYRGLHASYETARVYELLARAHRGLGERGAAAADSATALAIYRRLGALPDIRRLDGGALPGGLTGREADVLALIAGGASNKDTAEALFISQKTVGRHLANIFAKIGVSSRTAAAAWAHEHGLHPQR